MINKTDVELLCVPDTSPYAKEDDTVVKGTIYINRSIHVRATDADLIPELKERILRDMSHHIYGDVVNDLLRLERFFQSAMMNVGPCNSFKYVEDFRKEVAAIIKKLEWKD